MSRIFCLSQTQQHKTAAELFCFPSSPGLEQRHSRRSRACPHPRGRRGARLRCRPPSPRQPPPSTALPSAFPDFSVKGAALGGGQVICLLKTERMLGDGSVVVFKLAIYITKQGEKYSSEEIIRHSSAFQFSSSNPQKQAQWKEM